jgi:DNA repair exonuclease SbcCD ATPase subunit
VNKAGDKLGAYEHVTADQIGSLGRMEMYLCDLAIQKKRGKQKERRPEACKACESPCAYGKRWVKMLEAQQLTMAQQEMQRKENALAGFEPVKVAKKPGPKPGTMTKLAKLGKENAELRQQAEEANKALEKERKQWELDTADAWAVTEAQLKSKLEESQATNAAMTARIQELEMRLQDHKGDEKRLDEAGKMLARAKEELAETSRVLELVSRERDEIEQENAAAQEYLAKAERKLLETAEALAKERHTVMQLKARLWDVEHPEVSA